MAVLLMMAHSNKTNATAAAAAADEVKPKIFHDFLGRNSPSDSSPADVRLSEPSPSASSGGGRPPISTTSDLGSERQAGNHFEGVPFYGPRSDFSGAEIINRLVGCKRSNSDSAFMGSSRDGLPQSGESSHLMKMLRNAGGERAKQSLDEDMFFRMRHMRPNSGSLTLQPPTSSKTDANVSRWERAIPVNVGPTVQYPPRAGAFGYQAPSNRSKEANAGPSIASQTAADEGSRTGIKGSGLLSSINAIGGIAETNLSDMLPSGSKQKSKTHISDPESSIPQSQNGLTSASNQMTIFYGGRAHVFDDVPPNKADVIMALAGSNGGSWSTTYLPKSSVKLSTGESFMQSGESEAGGAGNLALLRDLRGRLPVTGSSSHGLGSGFSMAPGGHQGGIAVKDTRTLVQPTEPVPEEKREGWFALNGKIRAQKYCLRRELNSRDLIACSKREPILYGAHLGKREGVNSAKGGSIWPYNADLSAL